MDTKMIFEPLILRAYQVYTPGLKLRRLEFATDLVDVGKSGDLTLRCYAKIFFRQPEKMGIKIKNVNEKITFANMMKIIEIIEEHNV